jgi:hypothetical protein
MCFQKLINSLFATINQKEIADWILICFKYIYYLLSQS